MGDLFRSIAQGFGWKVGAKLAKEAIEDAKEALDGLGGDPKENEPPSPAPPPDPRQLEAERKARAKDEARRAQDKAREEARREKEIDLELAELKKRVAKSR